jgi:hypothetical protein
VLLSLSTWQFKRNIPSARWKDPAQTEYEITETHKFKNHQSVKGMWHSHSFGALAKPKINELALSAAVPALPYHYTHRSCTDHCLLDYWRAPASQCVCQRCRQAGLQCVPIFILLKSAGI